MLYNFFIMGSTILFFHNIMKFFNIENKLFEKYSVNMMRSLICGTIANEAYNKYNYLWLDKCLYNKIIYNDFKDFHYMFLSYFIFDTMIIWYQIYLHIEKNIRMDLLLHHLLAIFALLIIDDKKMYGMTIIIALSEGMTIVSGPKLLTMYYSNKYMTNIFIIYRLIYIVFIRIIFIWPLLIYYYYIITNNCDGYKDDKNMLLVIFLVMLIFHADINWYYSGRKELARI
jgi:hypothetical protein